jgi:diguanylate cyclase (GGDEF)-like protein
VAIDDIEVFLDSLRALLSGKLKSKKNWYKVQLECLTSAKEFFRLLKNFRREEKTLALVICDLVMPEMNGLEVLEKLKKILSDSVRVILTGKADLNSAVHTINNNLADQYLFKPIENPDQFVAAINMLLENYYLRKDQERKGIEEKIHLKKLANLNKRISNMQLISEQIAYFSREIKKLDLEEILDIIIKRIPPLFNAQAVSVFLFDEKSNTYHLVRDNHIGKKAVVTFDPSKGTPMQRAIKNNQIVIVEDINRSALKFSGKAELGDSCVIVPFRAIQNQSSLTGVNREKVNVSNICGILNLSKISSKEDRLIISYKATLIQDILGANISNAQLYKVFQETHKLAVTDGMTGLFNNRIFKEFLQVEYERGKRYNKDFSVVMADIDFFKKTNDKYGHLIGDQVLKSLGRTMKKSIRRSDIVARYGGEEFAFILPQTPIKKAFQLMEKVRKIIEQSSFTRQRIRITVSFGIAQTSFPRIESDLSLLEKADQALYRAKKNGRNRIEMVMKKGK